MKFNENRKYKLGDIVTIIDNLETRYRNTNYLDAGHGGSQMALHQGRKATIVGYAGINSEYFVLDIDERHWSWSSNMFKESYEFEEPSNGPYVGMYLYHTDFLPGNRHRAELLFQIVNITEKEILTKYVDKNNVERYSLDLSNLSSCRTVLSYSDTINIITRFGTNYLTSSLIIPTNEDLMKNWGVTNVITEEKVELKENMLAIPNILEYSKIPIVFGAFRSDKGYYTGNYFHINDNLCISYEKSKLIKHTNISGRWGSKISEGSYKKLIMNWGKAYIKNYEASSALFGHKTRKHNMFQESRDKKQTFVINNVIFNYEKEGKYYHVLEINDNTGNLKMLLEDIKLILPDLNNYNIPKDRTIKKNSECKIVKDTLLPIKKGNKVKVLEVFNRHKPFKGKYDGNSYAKVIDTKTNKQFECKLKQLKVI